MYFLYSCGKFLFASSVYDMYFSTESECGSCSVHCNVSAADNGNLLTLHDGSGGILTEGFHKVASGKVLICGEYSVKSLTGNVHESGKSCAGSDEYCAESFFFHKLIDGDAASYDNVGLDLNTECFNVLNLLGNNSLFGKSELGNTVYENSSCLVKSLKNGYVISELCKISRTGKSAGT